MLQTRRNLLALMAALVAGGAVAQVESAWAPRRLNPSERDLMLSFLQRAKLRIPEISAQAEFIQDHVRIRIGEDRLFRPGTANLSVDGVRLLTLIAEVMTRSAVRMEAVAHHHSDGQSYRSFIISQRRAQAVVAALQSRTIPPARLLATGLGENFPIATNMTEEGKRQNRRVELVFRPL